MPKIIGDTNGGIGSLDHSMLTELEYQALYGIGWILADGRNVAGSRYAVVKSTTVVPDFRGLVIRGKNNGRVDGNQNPDGDLTLGQFQSDAYGLHDHGGGIHSHGGSTNNDGTHNHTEGNTGTDCGGNPCTGAGYNPVFLQAHVTGSPSTGPHTVPATSSQHTHGLSINNSGSIIGNQGANETRSKNGTTNIFIRIN